MLSLTLGGSLFGFWGLLVAVPATAVLKILAGHLWNVYLLGEPYDDYYHRIAGLDLEPGWVRSRTCSGTATTTSPVHGHRTDAPPDGADAGDPVSTDDPDVDDGRRPTGATSPTRATAGRSTMRRWPRDRARRPARGAARSGGDADDAPGPTRNTGRRGRPVPVVTRWGRGYATVIGAPSANLEPRAASRPVVTATRLGASSPSRSATASA